MNLGNNELIRECCDPIYPPIPNPEPVPPALPTTTISPSSPTPTGRSGPNIKTAIAILNCILARQLCFEDPSCSAILEIIPRVCGPVPVSCSTPTIIKCKAALRTLQAFPFFRPTCLCKEPGVDPECNYFRDFLFDHPCGFVQKKEKDPYPIDALPTCNHALSVCQQERKCIKLFEDFKVHCKVRENKCRMEDRDLCHEAWTNLRLSPMFGCICPNNHMKRRCDRIFSLVNHNACVDVLTTAHDLSYGTPTNSINISNFKDNIQPSSTTFPYTFPYFLYPKRIPLALASHRPAIDQRPHTYEFSNYSTFSEFGTNMNVEHNNRKNFVLHSHLNHELEHTHLPPRSGVHENDVTEWHHHHHHQRNRHEEEHHQIHDHKQSTTLLQEEIMEIVRSMGTDDNFHNRLFDENMVLVETPLIAPPSSQYSNLYTAGIYPYNLTAFQSGSSMSSMENMLIDTMDNLEKHGNIDSHIPESTVPELLKIPFQSTCHIVLEACREDTSCSSSLQPVLLHCENHRCNRNACMEALQTFYRAQHEDLSLDIAFCLCKKTSSRQDICLSAQEKLHPVCAQKPPDSGNSQSTNGVIYQLPPTCHAVVDLCKEDDECKVRLEQFEQACAIDSVTRKCAGRANICRSALLGILGTSLRTTCSCQGADLQQIYECLGWHKLLWQNPCVVESQKDFHLKRLAELGLLTIPTMPSITTSTTVATFVGITEVEIPLHPIPPFSSYIPTDGPFETNYIEAASESYSDSIIQHSGNELNSSIDIKNGNLSEEQLFVFLTSETTEDDTTIATTTTPKPVPTRYCLVQRAHQNDQQIPEGKSKRLYLLDDPECSELCTCSDGGENPTLSCYALCVPLVPCRTALAFYSHASPAYQAFRGRCLCYSGRFICMRPPPGEYSLPGGVFLLLGYSSTDEALLRPHTNLGIQDAVRALQQYMIEHVNNQTLCTLTLYNMTDENVIITARLPHDPKVNPLELLRREKSQCKSILDVISHHINTQYTELSSDRLLSIFKMAEMQVIMPDISGSTHSINSHIGLIIFLPFLTVLPTIFKLYTNIYHIL
ncbi:glial cell line-derived neurotrophic family receptor-like, isoform E [Sergentomyia squamirostris]